MGSGIAISAGRIVWWDTYFSGIGYGPGGCCLEVPDSVMLDDSESVTPCSTCTDETARPWDGTFFLYTARQSIPFDVEYVNTDAASWNGKLIGGNTMTITYNCATGEWLMRLHCYDIMAEEPKVLIWEGKRTGSSVLGEYTRSGGCNTTTALTVIEPP